MSAIDILLGLDEASAAGWASPRILALMCNVGLLAAFLLTGRQGERALVPTEVLRNRVLVACHGVVLLLSANFFAALLYLPQYLEVVLGYSAIGAGSGCCRGWACSR